MDKEVHKLPRLFVPDNLGSETNIVLSSSHTHYLRNVLRLEESDNIRVFNGRNGEWKMKLTSLTKKSATALCVEQIRSQLSEDRPPIHLFFAPIKKIRQDFLIEKAVELGVTDLHPVLTQRTEIRRINGDRIHTQIIEATEQCERMDLARIHPLSSLQDKLETWPDEIALFAAIERYETAKNITDIQLEPPLTALIGPEGGFTQEEVQMLKNKPFTRPVSLGKNILRAETAALKILSCISTD